MIITELVGQRIKECMEERGDTYLELARIIGVTRQTMYAYLCGTSIIDVFKLDRIAKHYGKDIHFFCSKREFIGMNFFVETNLTIDEFNHRFIQWVEANGWSCGGRMYPSDDKGNPLNKEELHDNT